MAVKDCKPLPEFSQEDKNRFWSKVDIRGADDCWFWTRACLRQGYGVFRHLGKNLHANRIALCLGSGKDPFPLHSLHTCDVRYKPGDRTYAKCCNPDHLMPGTRKQNSAHAAACGRSASGARLDRRGQAKKLSAQKVLTMRALYSSGSTYSELASAFQVTPESVGNVVKRRTWTHI